tara:strand:- start:3 stop:1100 length:1098 start_codon:yes stop_codon:yes gene_type:complete
MTVSNQNSYISYTGNGSTSAYNWPFKLYEGGDLKVYTVVTATGVASLQTSGGGGTYDYTVAYNAVTEAWTVTLNNNLPNTHKLYLTRVMDLEQTVDYIEGDAFPATAHEDALDKIVLTQQQQQEQINRAFKLDQVNTGTTVDIATIVSERSGKVLGFDPSGNLIATQEIGTYKGNWAASTAYKARALVKDTSTNNIFLCNTDHTSSGSQPLTSNTDSAKWDLIVDAAAAATSATNAASSATAAANSATAASNSATAAANSATNAASSATAAASSASSAAAQASSSASQATAAAASFDSFDDIYLGVKSVEPSADNDGDALTEGDMYFNSSDGKLKIYSGGQWKDAAVDTSAFAQAGFSIAMAVAL